MYICICITDSLCCTPETVNQLYSNKNYFKITVEKFLELIPNWASQKLNFSHSKCIYQMNLATQHNEEVNGGSYSSKLN